jgi:uncharacterized protein
MKLIDLGADVNVKDDIGQTPLFYAAKKGHIDTCKILVKSGADIDTEDKKGKTAIQVAQRFKKFDVTDFLGE